MAATIKMVAESKYGFSGQYIAKITGRAARVQFAREFCGSKFGKRGEGTSYETDEIGLYEVCDVTKRGKDKTFKLVLPRNDGIVMLISDHEDALAIAKRLDGGEQLEDFIAVELGEALTEYQYYGKCSACACELASGESCPDHPEAQRLSECRQIPKLNDEGKQLHKLLYVIRDKAEVKAAAAAATLDTAIDAIVAALAALPAPLQKKALSAAKERLTPGVAVPIVNEVQS